jgi:hypothetical protein
MKSIAAADPTPADLKKFGLDKPAATVNLTMGSARATVLVGGKAEDGSAYARDGSRPAVMTIDAAVADDLKKGPDDYRRKDVFEFRPFNATRLEITRGGQTVVFEKVKGEGKDPQDKWRRVSPNPADVDRDKMDGLLSKLSNMRAASFTESTAKTGLDSPAMTVIVKFEDGKKEERITFGKADPDAYAARPGEPGAAKLDATEFTEPPPLAMRLNRRGFQPRSRRPRAHSHAHAAACRPHRGRRSSRPVRRRSNSFNTTSTPSSPRRPSSTASGACWSSRWPIRTRPSRRCTAATRARS